MGGGSGGSAPQINDSTITVHSFAAPPAPQTNLIQAYNSPYGDNQVIQARMELPSNYVL